MKDIKELIGKSFTANGEELKCTDVSTENGEIVIIAEKVDTDKKEDINDD